MNGTRWLRRIAEHRGIALSITIAVLCLAAALYMLGRLHRALPLQTWVFWPLALMWFWELTFIAGCLSVGHRLLHAIAPAADLPRLEAAVMQMMLGVLAFTTSIFVGGALHVLRPWFAVSLPFLLAAAGGRPAWRAAVAIWRERPRALQVRPLHLAALAAGGIYLTILYVGILTPASVGTDAAWFHLVSAQDYAREGRIVPFMADWARNLPQLTSILHTWAFLVPGLEHAPQRWIMALHTELVLVVWTLAGIVAATRWMLRRTDGCGAAWVVFFLFPAFYIYDSNLNGSADHIQAFFAIPLVLAGLRALETPSPRMAALAGAAAGGALMTKAQAVYLAVPVGLLLLAGVIRAAGSRTRRASGEARRATLGVVAFGAAAVTVLLPHLVKNAVFHHNPVYPFMMSLFPGSTPTMPDASRLFEHLTNVRSGPLWPRLEFALKTLPVYPFEILNGGFSPPLPLLGALFPLLVPITLLTGTRRMWWATGVGLTACLAWLTLFPTARNFQTFLPVLAALTAATIARAWERGRLARAGLVTLIGLQAVWGGDQPFVENTSRLASVMDTFHIAASGRSATRWARDRYEHRDLGRALPRDAVLLMHNDGSSLGIDRTTLLDYIGFQGLIDYRPMRTPQDVDRRYREVGITHIASVVVSPARGLQEEVLVDAFLYRSALRLGRFEYLQLWQMPASPLPPEAPWRVLCLGMPGYPDGVYPVEELTIHELLPSTPRVPAVPVTDPAALSSLAAGADAVVVATGATLDDATRQELGHGFIPGPTYDRYAVHIRHKR